MHRADLAADPVDRVADPVVDPVVDLAGPAVAPVDLVVALADPVDRADPVVRAVALWKNEMAFSGAVLFSCDFPNKQPNCVQKKISLVYCDK